MCDIAGAPKETPNNKNMQSSIKHNSDDALSTPDYDYDLLIHKLSSIIHMDPFKNQKPGHVEKIVIHEPENVHLHAFCT